jgi:hypothetical protein
MRIPFTAETAAGSAIGRLGRTEDLRLSPSGRRLAIAGYLTNRVLVLDVDVDLSGTAPRIALSDALEVSSASFDHPHGVSWLDDRTLIVANRYADIGIFELPGNGASGSITLDPVRRIGADRRDLVKTPGSISVLPIGLGLVELLVCNNFVHHVSRHLIDRRASYAVHASESLIAGGLRIPDGIAHSGSGRWIAVGNHHGHCLFVFRNVDALDESSRPDGVLRGVHHPHGVVFTRDERWVLVADAASPAVHVFNSPDGNWDGEREPVASVRILSDAIYERGRFQPGEGGLKGIDLTPDGALLVTTCEEDPLVFFDMRPTLGMAAVDRDPPAAADEAEQARRFLLRYLGAARLRVDDATEAIRRTSEQEVALLLSSRWWRLTAPFRRLSESVQYSAVRARHRFKPSTWRVTP